MMGFDGTSVTPHIRTLIEEHHVGCILLTAKNLKCEKHVLSCDLVGVPNALLTYYSRRRHYEAHL